MKSKKRIGLFGGTFDPIHLAHLAIVEAAKAGADLQEVLLMPSGYPPLKDPSGVSLPIYRYTMARLASARSTGIEVSDFEIKQTGPSYTLHTLKALNAELASPRDVYLICGNDVLFDLPNWYEPAAVLQNCTLLCGTRPGFSKTKIEQQIRFLSEEYGARIKTFVMPKMETSSTDIRTRLIEDSTAHIPELPLVVEQFLHRHQLYQKNRLLQAVRPATIEFLFYVQHDLWTKMTLKRLLHSTGTAMTALELALRFGEDPDKAVVAGVLHDIAKEASWRDYLERHPEESHWLADYHQVVHGPHGAELALRDYGITDQEVLNAITYHTTLRKNPSNLEKIIFLSDKIEPGRTFSDLKPIRKLAETDLNKATLACLGAVAVNMAKRGQTRHPYSIDALNSLAQDSPIPAIREEELFDN